MAGYDPSSYFPEGAGYNPLRREVPTPPPEDDFTNDMLERMEAMELQDSNFQIDLSTYQRAAAEPDENYVPPATFEDADASLTAAEANLKKYQQQLEDFARETQGLVPTDRASAREVKRRADMIAKGRKDIEFSMADVAAARAQLTAGKQAATEDPSWWQSALGYAGSTVGVVGKILANSPLAGVVETLSGLASYGAEGLGGLIGGSAEKFTDYEDSTWGSKALNLNPLGLLGNAVGVGTSDSNLRRRGRENIEKVGRVLGVAEEQMLDTPVLRQLTQLALGGPVGVATDGAYSPGLAGAMEGAGSMFGYNASQVRDARYSMLYEMAIDPLNLIDFGGATFTRLGSLRKVAGVNAGSLEHAALRKTLEEMPELAAKVPSGFDGSTLINDLRASGLDGETATAMSVSFDQLRKQNLKELRDLASADPQQWAATVRPYIEGSEDAGKAERLKALDRIADFGDDVDPILGRTFREQAELGQRLKVWDSIFKRFGDKPILRAPGRIWSQLTGESILHDIADKPELLELYFANRAFKADAGAEVLRYQQDVAGRTAKYLNDLNPEQVAQVQEALPNLVENPIYRNMVRTGAVPADLPGALQSAAIDLADLYDESAETLRAIQNRFGLKVADLDAQMGYFGREFSDELRQWLLENPNARAFLFADTTRRSKDNLSTAFLPEEKARKFREQDFTESEGILREKFRAMGLPDNIPVWSRDAFGNLIERAARSKGQAELRNLYGHFVEAYGQTDDAIVAGMRGLVDAEKAILHAKASTKVHAASEALAKTETAQAPKVAPVAAKVDPEQVYVADVYHGTNRNFDDLDVNAERVAIKDKAGRGKVRGIFFSPKEEVAGNYVSATFQDVVREAVARDKNVKIWTPEAVKAHYDKAVSDGYLVDSWAVSLAGELLQKRGVRAWVKQALDKLLGRNAAEGVSLVSKNADGFHVYDFAPQQAKQLAAVLRKSVTSGDMVSIVPHTEVLRPRVLKQSLSGKQADLTDPNKWPQELQDALKYGTREDRRVYKRWQAAVANNGEWQGLDVIERAPALQYWLEKHGYDFVKKPEVDDITGDFSYWVLNQKAIRKHGAVDSPVAGLEEAARAETPPVPPKAPDAPTPRAPVAARKAYDKAVKEFGTANPDTWSADQKAKWLEGKIGTPPQGSVNGLEVMRRANIKLPNDWDELSRIAASNFTPDQADEFAKLAKGLYWQHLDQPSKLYKGLSEIKAWFQKAVLARPGSVTKDLQGSMINGLMSGNTKYLDRAQRELGSLADWASGKGRSSDLVNRLRGAGVLRTQVDEALQRQSFLETQFPGVVGRAAGRVTKLGVVGGTIKNVTEGLRKAGKAVGLDLKEGKSLAEVTAKATDKMLDARVYFEEVNRVASALKAVKEGKSFEGAVQDVFKWWGKFDEMSKLDRKVLSQLLFFWAWWARSIPITVRHILTHPVRSRWLMTMMAGDADNDERAPNWLRRMGAWALGKGENGQYKAISLGGSSYFSPTMSMLQGNMVNQAMQGKPMEAASGALLDLARATPPYIQAIPEFALKHDLFTDKPWWRDKNAKTGSNAKAPSALWWFYSDPSDTSFGSGTRSAISEFLGLKATQTKTGTPYLTMDPTKSWMFGLIPGAEPALTDVSAFFSAPEAGGAPKVEGIKGGMRQLGLPIYNVNIDTAKSDIYEAKQALMQDADKLAGGSLYAENGQIRPNNKTVRGQEIASYLARVESQARAQGMNARDAKALALTKMEAKYPTEWRALTLYQRLEAWEDYLIRLEKGESEVDKELASAIMLTARRGDYNRVAKDAAKQDKKRLDKLELKPR